MNRRTVIRLTMRRDPSIDSRIDRLKDTMRRWGITITQIAMHLGVSRQYVWQVFYYQIFISSAKLQEIETTVEERIEERRRGATLGEQLRGARISAGFTLKHTAAKIGYTWVAIERWEKNICRPKPGVLWHLKQVYGVGEDWLPLNTSQTLPLASGRQSWV